MHSDILEVMGVGTELSSEPRYRVGPDDVGLGLNVNVTFRHGSPSFRRSDLESIRLMCHGESTESIIENNVCYRDCDFFRQQGISLLYFLLGYFSGANKFRRCVSGYRTRIFVPLFSDRFRFRCSFQPL